MAIWDRALRIDVRSHLQSVSNTLATQAKQEVLQSKLELVHTITKVLTHTHAIVSSLAFLSYKMLSPKESLSSTTTI